MEIIKKKIFLEDYIDRSYNSNKYGQVTATTFYFNIFLKQDIDDMGSFTNFLYIPKTSNSISQPDYTVLKNKLKEIDPSISFKFMTNIKPSNMPNNITPYYRTVNKNAEDYYEYLNTYNNIFGKDIKTRTENRIDDLKSYKKDQTYQINFDIDNTEYINYIGQTINGVSRIIQMNPKQIYVFDADKNNPSNKQNGLYYENTDQNITFVSYMSESFNITNTVLSAITKEEYLFGITNKPEVKSDVFIDRGITKVLERELRISEVKTVDQLERYLNNYFRVSRF